MLHPSGYQLGGLHLRKALLDPTSKLGYQIRELVQEIDKNEIEGVQSTDVKRSD